MTLTNDKIEIGGQYGNCLLVLCSPITSPNLDFTLLVFIYYIVFTTRKSKFLAFTFSTWAVSESTVLKL